MVVSTMAEAHSPTWTKGVVMAVADTMARMAAMLSSEGGSLISAAS